MLMSFFRTLPRMDLMEVTTVGLPFCAFKVLAGLTLHKAALSAAGKGAGLFLVALGVGDLVINGLNFLSLAILRRRILPACVFSLATSPLHASTRHPEWRWADFGNSLDVLVSFSLVAIMIGGGGLQSLSSKGMLVWNLSVIFNVMGAGLTRVKQSLKNFSQA
jgi:hypothetical protein